jgi:hypothetical protein
LPPTQRTQPARKKRLSRWFVSFGVLGIAVAFFVFYALSHELVIADSAIVFWPTSMVMLTGDDTFWSKTITITLAFIGNFLLYGLAGVIIGFLMKRVGRLFKRE